MSEMGRAGFKMDRVAERAAQPIEANLHHIALLHDDSGSKAETRCAEEVDMRIAGAAVARILEVVVLQILQRMHHVRLTGGDLLRPERVAASLDPYLAGRVVQRLRDEQFRPDRALAQLRMGEIEIVPALHAVVRELIARHKAHARLSAALLDACPASMPGSIR